MQNSKAILVTHHMQPEVIHAVLQLAAFHPQTQCLLDNPCPLEVTCDGELVSVAYSHLRYNPVPGELILEVYTETHQVIHQTLSELSK